MVSDDVPLVVSRQLLQIFAQDLGRIEAEAQKEIAHYALTQIQPRAVSFEEQNTKALSNEGQRNICFDFLQKSMNWISRKIYLYNVTFGFYMLDWWERYLFNILMIVLLWFIFYNGSRSLAEIFRSNAKMSLGIEDKLAN